MKLDEYKARLNEALQNADKAPALVEEVIHSLTEDLTTLDAANSKIKENETRIRDLQDTNLKLYLKSTTRDTEEDPPEKTPDDYLSDFLNLLTKEDK